MHIAFARFRAVLGSWLTRGFLLRATACLFAFSTAVIAITGCVAPVDGVPSTNEDGVSESTAEARRVSLVSITVTPRAPRIARGDTQQFNATGRFSDGTSRDLTSSVTWTSSNTRVATIGNSSRSKGLAIGRSVGRTFITARQGGVVGHSVLTVFRPTVATLVAISVTPVEPTVPLGSTTAFTAVGSYSDGTTQDLTSAATWTSSDVGVASVGNTDGTKGLVTTFAAGTTIITASLGVISGSTALHVESATLVAILVMPIGATIAEGQVQQFVAFGTFSDGTQQFLSDTVTWASSNAAVASVSNEVGTKGLVTGIAAGQATIVATLGAISGSTSLTVESVGSVPLIAINVVPSQATIPKGTTQQFVAIGTFADATTQDLTSVVTWDSTDFNVAAISNGGDAKGLATALSRGTVVIVAGFDGIFGTTQLEVTGAILVEIQITPQNPSIATGQVQQFTALGIYTDSTVQDLTVSVAWESSFPIVGFINQTGMAMADSTGTTTISASLGGITSSTTLTVTPAVLVEIAVFPANTSVAIGADQQFVAVGTYSDFTNVDLTSVATWSSTNSAVASISNAVGSAGLAIGISPGQAAVTATVAAVSGTTLLTVTP